MNKIFLVMPLITVCSFVNTMEQNLSSHLSSPRQSSPRSLPKKVDSSPLRDGIRRKLSNPVARLKVDQEFDNVTMKSEPMSPRKTYESIQDSKVKEMDLRRRSGSLDQK